MEIASGVDVVVSVDPLHVGYLTGYRTILCDVDRTYRVATVCTAKDAVLVTGASDAAAALEVLDNPAGIYRHGSFFVSSVEPAMSYDAMPAASDSFASALRHALSDLVSDGATVGIDAPDEAALAEVARLVGDFKTENVRAALLKSRSTKLPEEIAIITRATNAMEAALNLALGAFGPETTEAEIAGLIAREVVAGGGVPRGIVVTSGERTSRVDAYPTSRRIDDGDLVRFDLHATFDGYWTDMARTAVVNASGTREQQDTYAALLAGVDEQLRMARPGVTAETLFHAAVDTVRSTGLPAYQRNHCGHGLGLMSHEFPSIMPGNTAELSKGMMFSFETPFYRIGWGGMMIEDVALVTASGNTRLTQTPRGLIKIERRR